MNRHLLRNAGSPTPEGARPPSPLLRARELGAFAELGAYAAWIPLWPFLPRGDGHPVLILPGLMQSDWSTQPLRWLLMNRGYAVHASALGSNTGNSSHVQAKLLPLLRRIEADSGRKVSLVGWSMGGLYARAIAHAEPDLVRQVITLGSPFTGDSRATNAWRLYETLSGERVDDRMISREWSRQPPVPTTSVYGRHDGIVSWTCCLNKPGTAAENIETWSTHFGLGHNPAVLLAIADRLAQPADQWRPFEAPGALRWMFPAQPATD